MSKSTGNSTMDTAATGSLSYERYLIEYKQNSNFLFSFFYHLKKKYKSVNENWDEY